MARLTLLILVVRPISTMIGSRKATDASAPCSARTWHNDPCSMDVKALNMQSCNVDKCIRQQTLQMAQVVSYPLLEGLNNNVVDKFIRRSNAIHHCLLLHQPIVTSFGTSCNQSLFNAVWFRFAICTSKADLGHICL